MAVASRTRFGQHCAVCGVRVPLVACQRAGWSDDQGTQVRSCEARKDCTLCKGSALAIGLFAGMSVPCPKCCGATPRAT